MSEISYAPKVFVEISGSGVVTLHPDINLDHLVQTDWRILLAVREIINEALRIQGKLRTAVEDR